MNIEVYLHGVPAGFKSLSKDSDKQYLENFYGSNKIDVNTGIVIEIKNKSIYYTFLRNNLIANDGRNGSYFGLTLRLDDMFCEDMEGIYTLLSTIDREYIIGSIIKDNKYIVTAFNEEKRKNIEEHIIKEIREKFPRYLKAIDNSFSKQRGNVLKQNILEISNKNIISILKKNLIICLSEEYPTINDRIKATDKQLQISKSENIEISNKLKALQNQNNELEIRNNELRENNRRLQNQKNFQDNVHNIEQPIQEVAEYLRERRITKEKGISIKQVFIIVIVILLGINVFMFCKFNKTLNEIKTNTTAPTEEINTNDRNSEEEVSKTIDTKLNQKDSISKNAKDTATNNNQNAKETKTK